MAPSSSRAISDDSIAWQKSMSLLEFLGVMGSPFDKRRQDGPQAFAERGEEVFDPLTMPGAGLPTHHSMFLERSQLL
jgi:hypothetical protein